MLEGVDHGQPFVMTGSGKSKIELRPNLNHSAISGQSNVPTPVQRGAVPGFSLPIWNSDNEQIFFDMCVPNRWDEASNIDIHIHGYLAAIQPTTARAFRLQVSWEHYGSAVVVPDTVNTIEVETELDADTAAFTAYHVDFTTTNAIDYDVDGGGHEIAADSNLGLRLRRIAKTGGNNEIDGEFVVTHFGLIFTRNKLRENV